MCRDVYVPWSFILVGMADRLGSMVSGHQSVFLGLSRDF